jgi:hypothetical protein
MTAKQWTAQAALMAALVLGRGALTADLMPSSPSTNESNKTGDATAEFGDTAPTPRLYGFVTFQKATGALEQVNWEPPHAKHRG